MAHNCKTTEGSFGSISGLQAAMLSAEICLQLQEFCTQIEMIGPPTNHGFVIEPLEFLVTPKTNATFSNCLDRVFSESLSKDGLEVRAKYEGVQVLITIASVFSTE